MKRIAIAAAATAALAVSATAWALTLPIRDDLIVASQASTKRPSVAPRNAAPARLPDPVVVSGTAPGQAGFVHYFVITGPDGEPESQIGIELPDDRIVWSFPEMGVVVTPFIKSGLIRTHGKSFEIEHLYGLRPFRDEEAFRILQRTLPERTGWWLDQKSPYCDEERPSNRLCVSCLGFVLRVLYPGASPALPSMPPDFRSARKNVYTTEDLLLYLAGVRMEGSRDARLKRIASLEVPESLREQLARISGNDGPTASATRDEPRPAVAKSRSTGRSVVQLPRKALPRRGS